LPLWSKLWEREKSPVAGCRAYTDGEGSIGARFFLAFLLRERANGGVGRQKEEGEEARRVYYSKIFVPLTFEFELPPNSKKHH